jgi:hypothetical protein
MPAPPSATQFPLQQSAWDGSDWFTQIWKLTNLQKNVGDFGAKGDWDGSTGTDDTVAIAAAIDAAVAAGGGTVQGIPGKRYRLNTIGGSASGIKWNLAIYGDKIRLRNLHLVNTVADDAVTMLFVAGSSKPEGPLNWLKYAPWRFAGDTFAGGGAISPVSPNIEYPINAAALGAASITTTTPANAGNFAIGDYIFIRTGQLVTNGSNWNGEPDGEINRVISVNAGTGVLGVERPLAKPYASENQTAIGQVSSVGGGGSPAPLTVKKITNATIVDCGLENVTLENLVGNASAITLFGSVSGWFERQVTFNCLGPANALQQYRDGDFEDVTAVMSGTARSDYWPVSTANCSTDISMRRITGIATKKIATLHIHEGSARISARDIRLFSGDNSIASVYPVSVRSRVYGFTLDDYKIVGGGATNAIYIGTTESGGGRIGRGFARGSWPRTIVCESPNWDIYPPDDTKGGDIQFTPPVRAPALGLIPVRVLAGWVDKTTQQQALGTLPAQSIIIGVGCHVYEAFNGSVSNNVVVGVAGDNSINGNIDVSSAFNKTVPTSAAWGFRDTAIIVTAKYVPGGTQPTLGKALVWILVATAPTQP